MQPANGNPPGVELRVEEVLRGEDHGPTVMVVVAFNNDIAEVHTDAKSHAPLVRHIGAALVEFELDFSGASDRLDWTGELGNDTVAGAAEHTPILGPDQLIENTAIGFKGSEGGFLILAHEPGVPNHIGGQNCGKPALNAFLDHVGPRGHVPGHPNRYRGCWGAPLETRE